MTAPFCPTFPYRASPSIFRTWQEIGSALLCRKVKGDRSSPTGVLSGPATGSSGESRRRRRHGSDIPGHLKMNSSSEGNYSGLFCLLGVGAHEAIPVCLLEVGIIIFLTVLIISGNLIVIFVFHCAPLLNHHTTSYFIQTMAYADLLVGVSCLVPSFSLLHHSALLPEQIVCKMFGYVVSVLKSVSMMSLACISIDRYIAITKPLTYNTLVTACRLRFCILLLWVYSCAIFLPAFLGWGKPGYHGDVFQWCAVFWPTDPYFTLFIVVMLYAPAATTVCFTYFNIFRICQQHTKEINERRVRFSTAETDSAQGQPSPEKRYATVLFRITSVFYILWLPYIIYFLLESSKVYSNQTASFLTTWLAISNSFCNCVIYSMSNSVFQKGLKRLSGVVCASCSRRGKTHEAMGASSKRPTDTRQWETREVPSTSSKRPMDTRKGDTCEGPGASSKKPMDTRQGEMLEGPDTSSKRPMDTRQGEMIKRPGTSNKRPMDTGQCETREVPGTFSKRPMDTRKGETCEEPGASNKMPMDTRQGEMFEGPSASSKKPTDTRQWETPVVPSISSKRLMDTRQGETCEGPSTSSKRPTDTRQWETRVVPSTSSKSLMDTRQGETCEGPSTSSKRPTDTRQWETRVVPSTSSKNLMDTRQGETCEGPSSSSKRPTDTKQGETCKVPGPSKKRPTDTCNP
ncbi:probable G-protein coupled receptor 21 [Aquarana catesbeiana]|uniref:probable G-protein coupled receptor 21 n=1 Tax=Aquarana catesbeiana TaxID=8400 RepID=UPI003CCA57A8